MFQTVFSVEPLKKHKKNVLTQSKTDFEMSNYMSYIRESEQAAKNKQGKNPDKQFSNFLKNLFTH